MEMQLKEQQLREHLRKMLDGEQAHVGFSKSIDGIGLEDRGKTVTGIPYSAWQIIEHMRLAQIDILEFCRNPEYQEPKWPDDYWPSAAAPPDPGAWEESVSRFLNDHSSFKAFVADPELDLFGVIPHGSGQTYLREAILVADHNSYHIGQLVLLRRILGSW